MIKGLVSTVKIVGVMVKGLGHKVLGIKFRLYS